MNKAEFYWAMIGNASPEPVAVVTEGGKRVAYTCGCPDPLPVEGPEAAVKLISPHPIKHLDSGEAEPMPIPPQPRERARLRDEREKRYAAHRGHGWRRFNP